MDTCTWTALTTRPLLPSVLRFKLPSLKNLRFPTANLALAAHCSSGEEPVKVIDIGSGAGLPSIVLAIARPAWQLTLLESLQKRCDFLEHVAEAAGLANVKVVRNRAEDAGKDIAHRESYDIAVARAVAEMRVLAMPCLPLVRVGGILVAAKGPNGSNEYNLKSLTEHFHKRGLYKSVFLRIMEGEESLATYSPKCIVRSPLFKDVVPLLPPMTLFHGTADYSIPSEASVEFGETLRSVGATANTVLYKDKTHIDLILQVVA